MTKKKQVDWKVVSTGLICLTVLELYALSQGIDGKLLATVVGIIAVTIGIVIPNPISKETY